MGSTRPTAPSSTRPSRRACSRPIAASASGCRMSTTRRMWSRSAPSPTDSTWRSSPPRSWRRPGLGRLPRRSGSTRRSGFGWWPVGWSGRPRIEAIGGGHRRALRPGLGPAGPGGPATRGLHAGRYGRRHPGLRRRVPRNGGREGVRVSAINRTPGETAPGSETTDDGLAAFMADRVASLQASAEAAIAKMSGNATPSSPCLTSESTDLFVQVPAEEWFAVNAEVCRFRIERVHSAVTRMLAAVEREGLPSGSRSSWRRGTWA